MNVYAVWCAVGAYEGSDFCVGIYSDYVKARAAQLKFARALSEEDYMAKVEADGEQDYYITKVEVDSERQFDHYGEALGEVI